MFFKTIIPLIPTIKSLIKVSIIIYPLIWIMVFVTIITNTEAFTMQTNLKVDFLLFEKDLLISSLIHPILWIFFLINTFDTGILRAILFSSLIVFSEHILFLALGNEIELEIPFKMHIIINIVLLTIIFIKFIKERKQ